MAITKALTKPTNCTFRAKKAERHDQKFFYGASRRIGAPTFVLDRCPPLSNSFRRHWEGVDS